MHERISQASLIVRYGIGATVQAAKSTAAALLAPIGFRETLLLGGSALIGLALAPICPPASYAVPGTILVYVAIFGVK
jgi:hypothetical protein